MKDILPQIARNGAQPHTNGIAPGAVSPSPSDGMAAQFWRHSAPEEWAYFAHLCNARDDATGATLDRLRVADWNHPTSALIFQAAAALRQRRKPIDPDTLAHECACFATLETGRGVLEWENAAEACDALNTSQAPKGDPDKLAAQLADKLAPRQRWKFTPLSALRARPRPKWLIQDILIEATAAVLSGDSQSFKTFSALDMALSVATGTPWHGKDVQRGAVVYIAAEGGWTLRDRLEAWETARGVTVSDDVFHLLELPVAFGDPATVAQFCDFIKGRAPRFVVIDTLSACAEGLKENASEDMATFIRHMKATATATGAAAAVIHHNNKGGDLRGAVSLKNDADTHLTFARSGEEGDLVTVVSCSKHRGTKFPDFALQGEQITLSAPDEYGRAVTSLVFEQCEMPERAQPETHPNAQRANVTRARLLELFEDCAREHPDGVKIGTWKGAAEEGEVCSDRAFWRYRKALETAGEIVPCGTAEGSETYRRGASTATTATTANGISGSEEPYTRLPTATTATIPLGSGSCGSGSKGGSGSRKKQAQNSADSEPYAAQKKMSENVTF